MKQSLVRRDRNRSEKRGLKEILDDYRRSPSESLLAKASSALDKAAKKNTIHKNKANRIKGRLAKLLKKGVKNVEVKVSKAPKVPSKKKSASK